MKKDSNSGFTLLELLVTIAITAMVMIMIYGVLISSLTAKRYAEETVVANQVGQAVLAMIATDLRGFLVYNVEDEPITGEDKQSPGGADADFISFISAMDSKLLKKAPSDICRISYEVTEGDAEGFMTLTRTEQAYTSSGEGNVVVSSRLYDKIRSFNVIYIGPKGDEAESLDDIEEGFLPIAVKIELALESDVESGGSANLDEEEELPVYTFSTLVFLPTAADANKEKEEESEFRLGPEPVQRGPVRR